MYTCIPCLCLMTDSGYMKKIFISLGLVDANHFLNKRTHGETMRNIFWNKFKIYSNIATRFCGCSYSIHGSFFAIEVHFFHKMQTSAETIEVMHTFEAYCRQHGCQV